MEREKALKAIRHGAIAALVSGLLTVLLVVIAMNGKATQRLAFFNDPAMFVDIVLIFILAIGIYFKSRTAALFMFVYFIVSKIILYYGTQSAPNVVISLIFIFLYFQAVRGTFSYHRLEKIENPNYKSTTKWVYFLGIPIVAIFSLLSFVGVLSMSGVIPSTKILTGRELSDTNRKELIANQLLNAEDTIIYFYSNGLTSILEEGVFLTEDRVHYYLTESDGEVFSYPINLENISEITLLEEGDLFDSSLYQITTNDPDIWAQVPLSSESGLDKDFILELKKRSPNLLAE